MYHIRFTYNVVQASNATTLGDIRDHASNDKRSGKTGSRGKAGNHEFERPGQVMKSAVQAQTLFDGDRLLENHSVIIEDEHIISVLPNSELPDDIDRRVLGAGILAPGFIDVQVNGGGGVMFNSMPGREAVDRMTAAHRALGTTGMMPTLISDTHHVRQAGTDSTLR